MALEFELKEDEEEGLFELLEAFIAAQSAKDVHERHLDFPRSIIYIIRLASPFLQSFLLFLFERGKGGGKYGFPSLPKTTPFGNCGLRFPCPCPSSPPPSLRRGSAWVEAFALAAKNFSIFSFFFLVDVAVFGFGRGGEGEDREGEGERKRGREMGGSI